MGGLATGNDLVAWPESSKINRMHGGSRGWGLVRLATANLPTSLTGLSRAEWTLTLGG